MVPRIPLWREIQKNNFYSVERLADYLALSETLKSQLIQKPNFVLNVPERLAAKMAKNTLDDPIVRQFLPLKEEESGNSFLKEDPVEDQKFRKTPKLLQKYQGRALIVTTGACAMNCRFCFRKNFPYDRETGGFQSELKALMENPTLTEVILSGGDPLSLSDGTIGNLLHSLNLIPHLQRIRFHTRFPIGIPERIDDSFLAVLASSSKQIVFVIHCNHPKELDDEVVTALKKVQKLGIPLLNQSVLLHRVNDREDVLQELCEKLTNSGILPYYLHINDGVTGSGHFDVPLQRGEQLMKYLQKNLSGYGVPRLVREIPGMPSKTIFS